MSVDARPEYWSGQATSLAAARQAVWAVPERDWQRLTDECVDQLCSLLPDDPRRFLDVGCGIGRLAIPLLLRYPDARLVGLDASRPMLVLAAAEAKKAVVTTRVDWVHDEVGNGAVVQGGTYDAVFSVAVLQHLDRGPASELVARIASTVAPGGRIVLQTVTDADETRLSASDAASGLLSGGLSLETFERGGVFDCWTWVSASRPW